VIEQIRSIGQSLGKLDGGEVLRELHERINSVRYELDDIASELSVLSDKSAPDPERLQELNDIMAKLYNLQTKHKVLDIEGLIEVRESIDQKLSETLDIEHELQNLEASIANLEATCFELASELHTQRLDASSNIVTEVNRDLAYLGLPNAELTIKISESKSLGQYGMSEVEFLFASNKGSTPQPVHKVASGGELSRLMLIMKSLLAQHKLLPTMIFDEIDTGVSGEIALKMGEMMERLSEKMQVMSITHLPQIASKGKTHFYVYKQSDDTSTATFVKELQGSDRVMVLAQMLSGDNPTKGAIANAKELLN
jgi:DNA repair protein RecN (Recombination protein N)